MTAEIAILNKNAVALAADSAVTLKNPETQKVYNTANKLFMLSKYHPVGVMVFGPAYFVGVPWETVIKAYRTELHTTNFSHLAEFAENFVSFLEHSRLLFPDAAQRAALDSMCRYPLWSIRTDIDTRVKSVIEESGRIDDNQVEQLVTEVVNQHAATWAGYRRLPSFQENFEAELVADYREVVDRAIDEVLINLPIQEARDSLRQISAYRITRDWWTFDSGGIVIAGFGREDIFPVVHTYAAEAIIHNKLKFDHRDGLSNDVNESGMASIMPFGQGASSTGSFRESIRNTNENSRPSCRTYSPMSTRRVPFRFWPPRRRRTNEKESWGNSERWVTA
ncbi:MAG: hypothetical protein ACHP7P_11205 [Terriglobales bacterium]